MNGGDDEEIGDGPPVPKFFQAFLGTEEDTLLLKINVFASNLHTFKEALRLNGFPPLILNLLYLPIVFVILLFNRLKQEALTLLLILIALAMCVAFMGFIMTIGLIGARAMMMQYENAEAEEEGDEKDDLK